MCQFNSAVTQDCWAWNRRIIEEIRAVVPNAPALDEELIKAIRDGLAETSRLRDLIDKVGELSTGWKHGAEGIHLLAIQSLLSGHGA